MPALLIHDGYTLDGCAPARGPWPVVHFRYRPALAEDVYEYLNQLRLSPGKPQGKAVAALLHKHLVGWDVRDEQGELAPITPENLRRVPQPVLGVMLDAVMGYSEAEQGADVKN